MPSFERDVGLLFISDLPKVSRSTKYPEKLHHDILILTAPRVKSRVASQYRVFFHEELLGKNHIPKSTHQESYINFKKREKLEAQEGISEFVCCYQQ